MTNPSTGHIHPETTATLLGLMPDTCEVWNPNELSAILEHQLSAPIGMALGPFAADIDPHCSKTNEPSESKTLDDLLHHPRPSIEWLRLTQQFAKACATGPSEPLPREIALLLYYASIAVAEMRCGVRISELPRSSVAQALHAYLHQSWLGPKMQALTLEALKFLSRSDGAARAETRQ